MSTFVSAALAFAVIASFLLIGFGIYGLVKRRMTTLRGWLMIGAGAVTLLNIFSLAPMLTAAH